MNKLKPLTLTQARILRESLINITLDRRYMISIDESNEIHYMLSQVNDIIDNLLEINENHFTMDDVPF